MRKVNLSLICWAFFLYADPIPAKSDCCHLQALEQVAQGGHVSLSQIERELCCLRKERNSKLNFAQKLRRDAARVVSHDAAEARYLYRQMDAYLKQAYQIGKRIAELECLHAQILEEN